MSAPGNTQRTTTKDDYGTPPELFALLNKRFGFDLDVCANTDNHKTPEWFGPGALHDDAFLVDWCDWWGNSGNESGPVCWMNPPYSDVQSWVIKAMDEWAAGATIVAILPNSTDNKKWYHDLVIPTASEIWELKGRVQYLGKNREVLKRWNKKTQRWENPGNTTGSIIVVWRAHDPAPGNIRRIYWDWKAELD
jgi:phage N-6-adenine-methyltransferase